MIKRLLLAALFSIAAVPAFAACSSPVVVKDGAAANVSMSVATGADGNCQSKIDWDTSSQAHADMTAAIPAGTNLIGDVNLRQGGTALSATNGIFGNILQGNAVLSATNGAYTNLLVGNVAVATGTGATGSTSPRMTVATDQATNAGAALVKGGVGVVNGGSTYQHVAASQTAAVLQTSTGAAGDYLSHCVIYPVTTAAGSVTVFDNTNAAGTNVIEFATGTLSNLAPIAIPVGAVSTAGAWKVTTGANETVVCYGKFS